MKFSTRSFGVSQFVKYRSSKTTVVLVCSEICIVNNVNVMTMSVKFCHMKKFKLRGFSNPFFVIIIVRMILRTT